MCRQQSQYLVSNINIPSSGKATAPRFGTQHSLQHHRQLLFPLRGWKGQSLAGAVEQESGTGPDLSLAVGTDTGHDLLAEPKPWAANRHWLGRNLQLLFADPDHHRLSVWIALKGWDTSPWGQAAPGQQGLCHVLSPLTQPWLQSLVLHPGPSSASPATTRLSEPLQGAKPDRKCYPFFSYSYLNIYNHLVFVSPPTALLVTRLQLFSPLLLVWVFFFFPCE